MKTELDAAVLRVAESQYFILGPEVKELEQRMAEFLGVKHALGVSSGTDALLLALMALDIGTGDGVIVPTFSFFATAGVVSRLNATPIFVDVDPVTYNIDPQAIENAIARYGGEMRIKSIVPVHLFGQSADMARIMDIAQRHNLTAIEDAAQAIGVQYEDGRCVGSLGHVGCFSFFPSKNLGGYGDGGLVTTDDDVLAHRMEIMRVHGGEPKYCHKVIGGNFRLDALQAAVLNVKLPHLNDWSRARRANAQHYNELFIAAGLSETPGRTRFDEKNKVLLPVSIYEDSGNEFVHIYNQYCIRIKQRDELIEHLRSKQIGCEIYYPVPFHRQECFRDVPSAKDSFPVSDAVASTILALPIYPEMTIDMREYVVECISKWVKR